MYNEQNQFRLQLGKDEKKKKKQFWITVTEHPLIKSENKIVFHYLPLTSLDLFNQTPDRYKLGYGRYKIPNTKIGNGTQNR